MSNLPGLLVIRRFRPSKDGSWFKRLPGPADPRGSAVGDDLSSWVATLDDQLIAIATWQPMTPYEDARAAITRLWVDPEVRRLGIGTKLYFRLSSEVRKSYKKLGSRIREHVLTATCDGPAARPFLDSLKFDCAVSPPVRRFDD